jgi:hypothetical protein
MTVYRQIAIALFFVFVFQVTGWTQENAFIGTWKLNLAKSKFDPGPPPKTFTVKIETSGSNGQKYR